MASKEGLLTSFVSGGGEMGEMISNFNWTATSLGSINTWSQSLLTSVNLILNSTQPMWIGWGKENIFIYNDPYIEVLGKAKHAWALGKPAHIVWEEIWDFCGPLSDKVYLEGKASYVNNVHFFMNRGDFLEEVFYSFSYSPIYDETGTVGGLFCPNTETTSRLLNERRLKTLSELSAKALVEKTIDSALQKANDTIKKNQEDIPFAAIYIFDHVSQQAKLNTSAGLTHPVFALQLALNAAAATAWQLADLVSTGKTQVISLQGVEGLPLGLANQKITQAIVLPVAASGVTTPVGAIIAGVNPTRKLDEEYLTFFELLAGQVSTAYQNAVAAENERRRVEMLAEVNAAKTTFFSNISHEFRTPLTLMLGPLEELLNKPESTFTVQQRENIETTHRNAMRLLKLVNSLLDFSSLESGRAQIQLELTDLTKYTAELAATFRSIIENAGMELIVHCEKLPAPVYVDRTMWEKIVLNLLSNAFKYTLKGTITVSLAADGNNALLTVKDTGVGIPAKELPHMFERFHRVKNAAGRTHEGTGIGLSLVHELVNLHQGTIRVESTEQVGSTFAVAIPMGKAHLQPEQITENTASFGSRLTDAFISEATTLLMQHTSKAIDTGNTVAEMPKPAVLIVDDNADMLAYINRLLQNDYRTFTATNGKEALERIKSHPPDLVLSDIMMPVMDGNRLLQSIKNNLATSNIPVILLSARAGEESRIEGYDTGADDYLVKPFSAKELLARIRSQLKIVHTRKHVLQQLNNLFMQAPVAITVFKGPRFMIEVINKTALQLLGKAEEQVLNKPLEEAIPEIKGQEFEQFLNRVYKTGKRIVTNELPAELFRKGEKEVLFFQITYEVLRNESGLTDGVMMVAHNITEQVTARKLIEESEQRFRSLANNSPDIITRHRKDFRYLYASPAIEKLTGIQPEAFIGKTYREMGFPETLSLLFDEQLEKVFTTGKNLGVQYDNTAGRYFHSLMVPENDADGTVSSVLVLTRDITEQVAGHKNIEASEARFRTTVQQAPTGICLLRGPEFIVEVANNRMLDIWGKQAHDVLNRPLFTAIPEVKGQGFEEILFNVYTNGQPFIAEEIPVTLFRNGRLEEAFVKLVYEPLRNEEGHIDGIMAVADEVTHQVKLRKIMEENERFLRKTKDQFELSVSAGNIGIWHWDIRNNLLIWSKEQEALYGLPEGGFSNTPEGFYQFVHPEDLEKFISPAITFSPEEKDSEHEFRIIRNDGELRWIYARSRALRDEEGQLEYVTGINMDITNQKVFAEKLESLVEERTKELVQSNKELESFNYIASHDLQEPLRKIQTFTELLERNREDAQFTAVYLGKIKAAAHRMSQLIQSVLTYSKLSGTDELFMPTNLEQVLENVKSDFEVLIKEKQAIIESDPLPIIEAIPLQMNQLFSNLLSNALKFSQEQPVIKITAVMVGKKEMDGYQVSPRQKFIKLTFTDNGIGFEAQYSEKIFHLFQRLHGKNDYSGTGIGLSICKKIVERHQGSITATSQYNQGASFIILLPVNRQKGSI